MILNLIKTFLVALMICNVFAFETGQLPLSDYLVRTFPNINASCFIIINLKTNLVLHEQNSQQEVNTGTFEEAINGKGIKEVTEGQTSNLYNMALKFSKNYKGSKRIVLFSSAMSGVGCAFIHKNSNGTEFICILHGEPLENSALEDVKQISDWLEQFYEYEIPETQDIKIPVLYGTKREITFEDSVSHFVLLSKNLPVRINKVSRYRTIIKAPIDLDDELGFVFYQTEIFKNPIRKIIKASQAIKKANWLKCIRDSFLYLIFGATMNAGKGD